jgi:serine/threonine-protein kinase RIM15
MPKMDTPPQTSAAMPPPMMALFDPEDSNRRFVGTPDYLAPETINGAGQDEMSDWWSLGCILFECLYGRPPFNADTPDEVFKNILARKIQWPLDEEDDTVSEEAKDLVLKLMCLDPKNRLGSNKDDKFANGGDEIKAHPWFAGINWETLREDEASFIPMSENPEDTEYFDARGATMQNFAAEFEDQQSSPAPTPGADYPDRPHDALSRVRNQVNAVKRNLMPLHIPPHVRDSRSRRLSEPVASDDFGNFQFKNLPVLEKANKDVILKLRADALSAQSKSTMSPPSTSTSPSALPSLESSPVVPGPLQRTLSSAKSVKRAQSPAMMSQASASPNRGSQPSSPLLVSFSTGHGQDRRKTSTGSSALAQQATSAAQPGHMFDHNSRLSKGLKAPFGASSLSTPGKSGSASIAMHRERATSTNRQASVSSPRQRSHTLGAQEVDADVVPEMLPSHHHKRRSGVFDVSPSSSDNEETRHQAFLRVQRRRQSSRRLSQVNVGDGPIYRALDVLVCEDHPVSRLVMERLLEKLRCRTISVANGSEAMRYAMSEVKFDVIMMEYKLPQVNGADVARMIRDTKNANSHTPIVAVTGYLKELQAPHYFDALVEKPPTREKLEEILGRLCHWRPAPEGWIPTQPQPVPPSNLRQESVPTDDSPTTTTSSGFGGYGGHLFSSHRGSSREDSIGSSSFGETDSHFDSIPVIISQQSTSEWDQSDLERNFGGLGITDHDNSRAKPTSHHMHHPSAPAILASIETATGTVPPTPRKQPSMEAIQAKRRSLEKVRQESAAESGDDEDEELGNIQVRQRSPSKRNAGKRTSKLGTEMMRTNSQGSVVSSEDLLSPNAAITPRSPRSVAAASASPMMNDDLLQPGSPVPSGGLTPPEIFPRKPGHHAEIIDMDAAAKTTSNRESEAEATPKASSHATVVDESSDPTPKARVSSSIQHSN